jgi:cytoskeletal protein RodZ
MNKSTPVVPPNFDGEEMKIPTEMNTQTTTESNQSLVNGPILILLFAILVAILGGIYYWYTIVMSTPVTPIPTRPTAAMNNEPESATAEARTDTTSVVSTSDELDAITADVESLNLEDIETNITAIDTELDAATSSR